MSDYADPVNETLRLLARLGDTTPLRGFALACAREVARNGAAPPLWTEALGLLQERVYESVSEGTFRHRAASIECRFPLPTILSGLRKGDPGAAAALTVMAALRTDPLEAAVDAARGERLVTEMAAQCQATHTAEARGFPQHWSAPQARRQCAYRQLARLVKRS